jgi:SAM-dependent methyltransferase
MSAPSATATAGNAERDPRAGRLYPVRTNQAWVLTRLRESLDDLLRRVFSQNRAGVLIDYGCGSMPYRELFEPHVSDYVGCDLPGNSRADCVIESIARLPQQTGAVSIVLSTQVLEHVEDPAGYLREAFRVLAPGGHLILSTHGAWRYHPDPTDFWRWTSAGLKKQVSDAGFTVIHFTGLLGPIATSLQLFQDTTRGKLPYRLQRSFIRLMQWLVEWADRRCGEDERQRDACVYVLVGLKPPGQVAVPGVTT